MEPDEKEFEEKLAEFQLYYPNLAQQLGFNETGANLKYMNVPALKWFFLKGRAYGLREAGVVREAKRK